MSPKQVRAWKRVIKWLVLTALATLVLVILGLVGIRLYYTDERLTALVRSQLKQHVPLDVSLGRVELRLLKGIVIKDLTVGPPTSDYKENVLTLKEARVGYRLWPLLDKKVAVDEVALDVPSVTLEMQQGKWNVLAIADKFAGEPPASQPATAPASQPASQPEDTDGIGVEINLKAFTIDEFSARVLSPEIEAALDHLSLRVNGRYTGLDGAAHAELYIGDDTHGPSQVHAVLAGTGAADLEMKTTLIADAPSLSQATVDLQIAIEKARGEMAGFRLPSAKIALATKAAANLLTQKADVERLSLTVGDMLTIAMKASAGDFLGDVDIKVDQADLDADIDEVLALLPKGMVPVTASGSLHLRDVAVRARLSELTALTPFDAKLGLKLQNVAAQGSGFRVAGTNASLAAVLTRTGSLDADLGLDAGEIEAGGAKVTKAGLTLNAKGPASALQAKLTRPLVAKLDLRVPSVALASPSLNVETTTVTLDATLFDFAANGADATVTVAVGNARYETPELGALSVPLKLALKASRRAPALQIEALTLDVADVVKLALAGSVVQKPKGVFDLALTLALADVALKKLVAIAPTKLREQLSGYEADGSLGLNVAIKGPVTADIGKHFAQAPLDLLDAGTPFELQAALAWKGIAARYGEYRVGGSNGSIGVQTRPKRSGLAVEIGLGHFVMSGDMPATLDDAMLTLDASYENGEAFGAGNIRLGKVEAPTQLTMALKETALDYDLAYARGGEVAVNRIALSIPTLGAAIMLRGRMFKPERVVATKAWENPTWKGIVGDLALNVDVDLPQKSKLLPKNDMLLGGGVGLELDGSLADGHVKLAGALKTKQLNVQIGDMTLKNLSGTLPFAQDAMKTAEGVRLVLSKEDILKQKPRIAYYSDLRSYGRDDDSLRIERFTQGRTDISRIALNGRLASGMLLVDHFSLEALTGDLEGQLALQFGADKVLRLSAGAKFSNIDLSVLSKTPPGPTSQINGNLSLNLQWGEKLQEIDATNINLTRIGREMLSQLILALDPDQKNEKLQNTRKQIESLRAKINLLRVSIIHNTANFDLDATTKLDFFANLVGQRMINTDLLRRQPINAYLEQYLVRPMAGVYSLMPGWKLEPQGSVE